MVSKRAQDIPPFIVMEILERAKELEEAGRSVIHMEIGEPDFETPEVIKRAGQAALEAGHTQYTHSLGLPELRQAIAERYADRYSVEVDPERVIVTTGSSSGMLLVFAALLDPGQEVILSNPCYSCYPNFVRFVGGRPVMVGVSADTGFSYRPADVRDAITDLTRAIMVNSPSNPTGTHAPPSVLEELAGLTRDDLLVVSDEIYHGMTYGEKDHSILEFSDQAVVISGFSKLFAMTGWRLGYLIVPPDLVRPIQKFQQNLFISANSFVQWAGVTALKEAGPDVKKMVETYDERRRYLVPALGDLGLKVAAEPTGAFYVLADIGRYSSDSHQFTIDLLEKTGVAVTPGVDFGSGAEGYVRFSYANSLDNLKEGCRRLSIHLANQPSRD